MESFTNHSSHKWGKLSTNVASTIIDEVRNRPYIFDPQARPPFSNFHLTTENIKIDCWEEISNEILKRHRFKIEAQTLKDRWRVMRDSFVKRYRCYGNKIPFNLPKSAPYMLDMMFLIPVVNAKGRILKNDQNGVPYLAEQNSSDGVLIEDEDNFLQTLQSSETVENYSHDENDRDSQQVRQQSIQEYKVKVECITVEDSDDEDQDRDQIKTKESNDTMENVNEVNIDRLKNRLQSKLNKTNDLNYLQNKSSHNPDTKTSHNPDTKTSRNPDTKTKKHNQPTHAVTCTGSTGNINLPLMNIAITIGGNMKKTTNINKNKAAEKYVDVQIPSTSTEQVHPEMYQVNETRHDEDSKPQITELFGEGGISSQLLKVTNNENTRSHVPEKTTEDVIPEINESVSNNSNTENNASIPDSSTGTEFSMLDETDLFFLSLSKTVKTLNLKNQINMKRKLFDIMSEAQIENHENDTNENKIKIPKIEIKEEID